MKKTLLLLLLLPGLLACNNEDKSLLGDPEDYYRIDFYSDYVGIDYANPDLSEAKLISTSYCLKTTEQAKRIAAPKVEEGGVDYTVPTQIVPEGKALSFAGWVGSYADGTKIDTSGTEGYAIINGVKESGVVFAYFEANPLMYSVNIKDNGKSLYSGQLPYGTNIALSSSSIQFEDEAGEKKNLTLGYSAPNYYTDGAFSHFELTIGDGEAFTYGETSYIVKDKVTIEAVYEETSKDYTVTFAKPVVRSYDDEDKEVLTPIAIANWGIKTLTVAYDGSIKDEDGLVTVANEDGTKTEIVPKQLKDDHGQPFTLQGFQGVYAASDPAEVAGKSIDPGHIRYNCALTPIYEAEDVPVTFVYFDGEERKEETRYAAYGEGISAPRSIPSKTADNGETLVFTGKWKSDAGEFYYPEELLSLEVKEPLVLTAEEYVPEVTVVEVGDYKVGLDYDYAARGYDISSLTLDNFDRDETYTVDLSDIDSPLPVTAVASIYPKKEGEAAPGNLYRNITSITFPSSLRTLKAESLYGMSSLTSLDLSNLNSLTTIEFNCFKNCFALNDLTLPSSITMIERNAFQYCDLLNEVKFKGLTEDELKNKVAAFEDGWNDRGRGEELEPVKAIIA